MSEEKKHLLSAIDRLKKVMEAGKKVGEGKDVKKREGKKGEKA